MSKSPNRPWTAIVLAAGQGTRMGSPLPKVLHQIAGRSLLAWAVDAALGAGANDALVVVGHGSDDVKRSLDERYGDRVRTVLQAEQNGTGHAVQCALDHDDSIRERVVVMYGDCPLIRSSVLRDLMHALGAGPAPLGLITGALDAPAGYGRIVRDAQGTVQAIVEDRDCSEAQRAIQEVNPGIYACETAFLRNAVRSLTTGNAQGELYLTDVVAKAYAQGGVSDVAGDMQDLLGVNDHKDLAQCAARRRAQINDALAQSGVALGDSRTTYVDADCRVEPGTRLGANVHLRGACVVGAAASVDVGCVLTDVEVAPGASVLPYTVATQSKIGRGATVGPFAHLRPGTELHEGSKVGNFSETKNTILGEGSKLNHLSYAGDGRIGKNVNIGAGTIFCNYDGANKHITILEDNVFIGSGSQLVAPVTVGEGAYVGSGTTVTKDVPPDSLAVGRAPQKNKEAYASRLRARQGKKER